MNEQEKKEEGSRLFREAEKYRLGKNGLEVDYNKAKELYEQAIELKHAPAMNNLGWLYKEGKLGDKPDYNKAKELYEQAIELKQANAMNNLGWLYKEGKLGDKPDYNKAKELYEQAIELKHTNSMYNLAWLYKEGKLGGKPDYNKAKELYEQAIELKHANSMYNLGLLYQEGKLGDKPDYNKAKELYEQAIELKHANSMYNLGLLYQEGKLGDKPDYNKAKELYEQAIELGSSYAMFFLGLLYEEGKLGDKPDYDKAKDWYKKAIELGNSDAMFFLGLLYQEGKLGDKPDYNKAKQLCETASDLGNANAMYNLGMLYDRGKLGKRNAPLATRYFEMAHKHGHPYAHAYCPNPLIKQVIKTVDEIHRDQIQKSLTDLEETFFSIRNEHRREGSVQLAHFTAWPAIESILSLDTKRNPDFSKPVTNCLRQYHVDYMNDPKEGRRLLDYDNSTGKKLKDLFDKHYFDVFKTHQATTDLLPSMFTVSLTKETDRLDLWRAYGRDGAGLSLSLNIEYQEDLFGTIRRNRESAQAFMVGTIRRSRENTQAFIEEKEAEDSANTSSSKTNLAPPLLYAIKYKNEDVKAALDKLRKPLQAVLRLKNTLGKESEDWQRVASCATAILLELLYLYKDEQYCNEHEVRALRTLRIDDEAVKLDERTPGRLYCETSPFLFRTPGSEIIVGPKVENKEAALWNIRHRLAKLGLSPNTIVKESALEYR